MPPPYTGDGRFSRRGGRHVQPRQSGATTMPERFPPPIVIAYRDALMRRIICMNLECEGLFAVEAESAGACCAWLAQREVAAVVLDARLLTAADELSAVQRSLHQAGVRALVVADGPEYRPLARQFDDAP